MNNEDFFYEISRLIIKLECEKEFFKILEQLRFDEKLKGKSTRDLWEIAFQITKNNHQTN